MPASFSTTVRDAVRYSARSRATVACFAPSETYRALRCRRKGSVVGDARPTSHPSTKRWGLAALPSVGVAVLPKLTCPLCWPAYTAVLGSIGINFVDYTPYLLPTLTVFLAITLWALAYRAEARRGYGPLALGALGAGAVLTGKFVLETDLAMYTGAGLLLGAALWNLWPGSPQKQYSSINQGAHHG